MAFEHRSVMTREVVEAMTPRSGGVYADATVGGAGHSAAILEASAPDGRLLAMDRDPRAIEAARSRLSRYGDRATVVHGCFADLGALLREHGTPRVDGVVADLGVSSPQLDDPTRGFSLQQDGPLDMRMDDGSGESARELLGRLDERELADILYELGEERRSRAVARSILRARDEGRLATTRDLRAAVVRALGPRRGRVDPATRTFQALRIAVNRELDQLDTLLADLPELLADDGVAVMISFHSLEDRRVKRAFRDEPSLSPLTKRPRTPGDDELRDNPRSRRAKLRAARRVARTEAGEGT